MHTAARPPSSSPPILARSSLDNPRPLWMRAPIVPPSTTPLSKLTPPDRMAARTPAATPVFVCRAPSLWVLTLPLSSLTSTPIEPSLISLLALSQFLIALTARSAASSLSNRASTSCCPAILGFSFFCRRRFHNSCKAASLFEAVHEQNQRHSQR